MKYISFLVCIIVLASSFSGCQETYSPKPRGFYRIEFPLKQYEIFQNNKEMGCPFTFTYPSYAKIQHGEEGGLLDLVFPDFNARLHLTYIPIRNGVTLNQLTEDAHDLAFKHTVKATGIDQTRIQAINSDVHGVLYEIKGNTASSIQFFLTDSTQHYIRAALYFNEKPRIDSIQPVLDFIKKDIHRFVEDFQWKY